jgi:hypothetical protein
MKLKFGAATTDAALKLSDAGGRVAQRGDAKRVLDAQRLRQRLAKRFVAARAIVAQTLLRQLAHVQRQSQRCVERGTGLDHTIRQAHSMCLVGAHRSASDDHVECVRHAHQSSQAHRAAINQRHAETTTENA